MGIINQLRVQLKKEINQAERLCWQKRGQLYPDWLITSTVPMPASRLSCWTPDRRDFLLTLTQEMTWEWISGANTAFSHLMSVPLRSTKQAERGGQATGSEVSWHHVDNHNPCSLGQHRAVYTETKAGSKEAMGEQKTKGGKKNKPKPKPSHNYL